ncbi:unnamed protein product [Lactuca saligna]|uniref:Uncharacterized protein n=1 Tax=Lactuca saligna TaxID=75948 RepID=A0AA35ZSM5_LACSI|nr:unnamed protein product [Lactuca saligna]
MKTDQRFPLFSKNNRLQPYGSLPTSPPSPSPLHGILYGLELPPIRLFSVVVLACRIRISNSGLSGVPVYALSNSSEEFVVVSGQNPVKSLGLFCFKEEDAETLLGQMKSMDPRMRPGSKVVPIALSMRKVNGVSTVAVSSARNPDIDILLVLANLGACVFQLIKIFFFPPLTYAVNSVCLLCSYMFQWSQFCPLIPLSESMPKELGASLHYMLNLITGMATQQIDTGLSEALVAMFSDLPVSFK